MIREYGKSQLSHMKVLYDACRDFDRFISLRYKMTLFVQRSTNQVFYFIQM